MAKYSQDVVKLVIARLNSLPPDVSFAVGEYGTFTRDQLIKQVKEQTEVGDAAIRMELAFIKKMPQLASSLTK